MAITLNSADLVGYFINNTNGIAKGDTVFLMAEENLSVIHPLCNVNRKQH